MEQLQTAITFSKSEMERRLRAFLPEQAEDFISVMLDVAEKQVHARQLINIIAVGMSLLQGIPSVNVSAIIRAMIDEHDPVAQEAFAIMERVVIGAIAMSRSSIPVIVIVKLPHE